MKGPVPFLSLLLTGASGQLGSYVLRQLQGGDTPVVAWSGKRGGELFGVRLQTVDLADADEIRAAFRRAQPTCVIHAAAMSRVGECYENPERAGQINTAATGLLAELSARAHAKFVFVSTDMVFDGEKGNYRETDLPYPQSVYGRSKAAAEKETLRFPDSVVARVSLLYGPALQKDRPGFFDHTLANLRRGVRVVCFEDEWRTPLSCKDAAGALLTLSRSDFSGVIHLGGPERLSRLDMGRRLAAQLGVDDELAEPGKREMSSGPETRPRDLSLDSGLWRKEFPERHFKMMRESLEEMLGD